MRNRALVLALCLGTLIGCSSKPDVGDIEAGLKEVWGTCPGLKMTDLKKTNGIDHGKTYEMAASYRLTLVKEKSGCPPELARLFFMLRAKDNKLDQDMKVGDSINVDDTWTMVESEKGWVVQ
ncbi:hypothetical protein [Propionivibrio sp.]|uniref:hypothetical protein n=1 Tax=Propionivibrio sp. TaxID=2212460 RepID=UPI00272ECA09|nr:hypothetical protein [Propionivibrio sp.]